MTRYIFGLTAAVVVATFTAGWVGDLMESVTQTLQMVQP